MATGPSRPMRRTLPDEGPFPGDAATPVDPDAGLDPFQFHVFGDVMSSAGSMISTPLSFRLLERAVRSSRPAPSSPQARFFLTASAITPRVFLRLLGGRPLDHDAAHRLRAGVSHQHPSPVPQLGFSLADAAAISGTVLRSGWLLTVMLMSVCGKRCMTPSSESGLAFLAHDP